MNCKGLYLAEGFFHNLFPCFHIVFAQLGVMTRASNKFVEIVDAAKRYLSINSGIKEATIPTMHSSKIN